MKNKISQREVEERLREILRDEPNRAVLSFQAWALIRQITPVMTFEHYVSEWAAHFYFLVSREMELKKEKP